MKQNQNARRQRGRSSGKQGGGNFSSDSSRPEQKPRGNAAQLLEKYKSLARDAQSAGDRVLAEHYFQHADHYQRVVNERRSQREEQNEGRQDNQARGRGRRSRGRHGDVEQETGAEPLAEATPDANGHDQDKKSAEPDDAGLVRALNGSHKGSGEAEERAEGAGDAVEPAPKPRRRSAGRRSQVKIEDEPQEGTGDLAPSPAEASDPEPAQAASPEA